ncbi:hypothetical protein AB0O69_05115 [Streptomyces xiamenensis]|uniref:hypothetical protein n=1 Tax=Streptomyces xiamenensis TaxID=408015 RepID=UPI00341B2A80
MLAGLIGRGGRWPSILLVVYVVSAAALSATVVDGNEAVFFTALVLNYAADWALRKRGRYFNRLMRRFGFGERIRELYRLLLLVALALSQELPGVRILAVCAAVLFLANSCQQPLVSFRVRRRNLPVAALNMDMGALARRIPDLPSSSLLSPRGLSRIPGPELLLAAGAAAVVAGADEAWMLLAALAPLPVLISLVHAAWHAFRNLRLPDPAEVLDVVNRNLAEYRPEVALYFTFAAGGQDFMYQVNMWVDAMEKMDRRGVIILRETAAMRGLEQTRLPVVCVRKADDLAQLDLSDVRVAFYPGNAGKNVHMLQRAEIQHVFIGHGDSDKLASSNRVSRVFDEIWVAGKAGRDRYQRVRHAISDSSIVEVGRPQLSEVRPAGERLVGERGTGEGLTVLYGPTWEGWTDDACHTSVIPMGEAIIGGLLEQGDVRVIYKPHPLTGKRSAEAAAADALIERLLTEDNVRRAARRDPARVAVTERELARLEARMAELSGAVIDGDRLQRTRDARVPERDLRAEIEVIRQAWSELFWSDDYQGGQHLIVKGRLPSLYDCFNHADLLISDMSSVISDFVASRKPYVVTNAEDMDPQEYRLQNPTAGAAYLLGSACEELSEILGRVRGPVGADPMARRRTQLKEYLLGADEPSSTERFNGAVEALYRKGLRAFPLGTTADPVPASPDYTDVLPGARVGTTR